MKLSHLPPEEQERITTLGENIRSMEDTAKEAGDPLVAAMVHYLGAALLKTTLTLAGLEVRFTALEEFIEDHLEVQERR